VTNHIAHSVWTEVSWTAAYPTTAEHGCGKEPTVSRHHDDARDQTPTRPPRGPRTTRPTAQSRPPSLRREPRVIDDERPLRTTFDITLVDGERRRQLALVQARAIREVLTWWATQNTPETSSTLHDAA
jgi:hypothetical protein